MHSKILRVLLIMVFSIILIAILAFVAHKSNCQALHSCASATANYTCGDIGYCYDCEDNDFCRNKQPHSLAKFIVATSSSSYFLGAVSKTSNCQAINGLSDPACTPGAAFASATVSEICHKGYTKSVRNVPESVKNQVYHMYGIYEHKPYEYEVDHLVSLEIGGSNEIANLWPEAASPTPGYHEKDLVENFLNQQVCNGLLDLKTAQYIEAKNWLSLWPINSTSWLEYEKLYHKIIR